MFISFLYMFWVTVCPSSGEITASMRHLVLVTLCGRLSSMHTRQYSARLVTTHSIRIFPLHFPSRASPCAIKFRTRYTTIKFPESSAKDLGFKWLPNILHVLAIILVLIWYSRHHTTCQVRSTLSAKQFKIRDAVLSL